MKEKMTETIGLIASIFLSISGLPQVIKSWKTKKVEDISFIMILLFVFAFILWIIYGVFIKSFPIVLTNSVSLLFMGIALFLKIKFN